MKKVKLLAILLGSLIECVNGITVSENVVLTSADDISAYTGADEIVIGQGATLEFSGITDAITLAMSISGSGTLKTSSCTSLKLSGNNSDFEGAMVFDKTKVEVAKNTALGSATVDFTNNGYAEANALLFTAAGTYTNDITCRGTWLLDKTKDVVFTGVITLSLSASRSELGSLANRDKGSFRFQNQLVRTTGNSIW